jgi:hypothetical protein
MERLTEASLKWCSTYDIGRVAAKQFSDPNQFNGMTTELVTWEGSVHDLASAMEEVTNQKTVGKLAMPNGKKIYFDENELVQWLKRKPTRTLEETEEKAASYIVSRKGSV